MIINDIPSIMSIMKNANFEGQEFNETVTELKNSFFMVPEIICFLNI